MSGEQRFVSGFVSILGRPNVGKSTLLNALVGSKIAIVTDKPQTTRNRIQGVVHRPHAQIIFLDTPGIHRAETRMNQRMMAEVREALKGCDLLLLMVDASREFTPGDEYALALVQKLTIPVFLLPNKIDLLANKEPLLPLIDRYRQQHPFAEIIPISAIAADGLQTLEERILAALPEGPQYFPPDYLTDQPARFLAAEIIREKVIVLTRQELPYATMVLVERFEEKPGLLRIHAAIFVERPGQKGILIGTRGEMMKKIGTRAREELEKRFGQKVYLELFVKVRPGWRENPRFLRAIDWRSMVGEDQVTSDE
jgi:GTP-binding protein Era